jgi:hypothetical protein
MAVFPGKSSYLGILQDFIRFFSYLNLIKTFSGGKKSLIWTNSWHFLHMCLFPRLCQDRFMGFNQKFLSKFLVSGPLTKSLNNLIAFMRT